MALDYTVRPLSDRSWLRHDHTRDTSQFTASWADTQELLAREVRMLDGKHLVVGIDVEERHLRLDGRLRADAKATTPAVEVAFQSKHGPLLYRCDRFVKQPWRWRNDTTIDWQHNVRAIAMTLQALRAVDRYAATASGEQYRGYRQLPAGRGDAASGMTATAAAEILVRAAIGPDEADVPAEAARMRGNPTYLREVVRQARAATHPDRHNGDTSQWHLVDNAEQTLRQAGWLPKAVAS